MTSRVSQKVAVSVVYVAAMFMTIMDATIVNVALPSIGRTFEVASTSVASISIYFLVSLAVFMTAFGLARRPVRRQAGPAHRDRGVHRRVGPVRHGQLAGHA